MTAALNGARVPAGNVRCPLDDNVIDGSDSAPVTVAELRATRDISPAPMQTAGQSNNIIMQDLVVRAALVVRHL